MKKLKFWKLSNVKREEDEITTYEYLKPAYVKVLIKFVKFMKSIDKLGINSEDVVIEIKPVTHPNCSVVTLHMICKDNSTGKVVVRDCIYKYLNSGEYEIPYGCNNKY